MRFVLACLLLLPLPTAALWAQPSVDLTFIREFGSFGDKPGQFNLPHAIDIDRKGHLIIADEQNRRVQICSQEGDCHVLGSDGAGSVDFLFPRGVVADNHGQILVTEVNANRLQVCDYKGNCDTEFVFEGPGLRLVDVDGQGHIAVVERFSKGVHICDYDAECSIIGNWTSRLKSYHHPVFGQHQTRWRLIKEADFGSVNFTMYTNAVLVESASRNGKVYLDSLNYQAWRWTTEVTSSLLMAAPTKFVFATETGCVLHLETAAETLRASLVAQRTWP